MIAWVFAIGLAVSAHDATPPAPPAPPAPLDPVESAPPPEAAPSSETAPTSDPAVEKPRAEIGDPLVQCKAMLHDGEELATDDTRERDARLDIAEKCFRERALVAKSANDVDAAARALAMADVVAAWRASAHATPPELGPPLPQPPPAQAQQLSLTSLVESGRAEALLHGAAAGAVGGFLLTGAWFSTTRDNEADSLPWLVASPAVGAVAGAAGAWALVEVTEPTTGDIAFASSAMWMGAAQGLMLELAVFDGSAEVSSTPLRFLTVFGGGTVGLAAGVALSPFLDVTQGDAAVANSAALWGGVMSTFAISFMSASGSFLALPQVMLLLSAGSTVPYIAVIAAHPYLNIERWPSWLIEAGGAGGFLVSGAALVVLGSQGGLNPQVGVAVLGAGTLAGVVTGAAAAWAVSTQIPSGTVGVEPRVAFTPTLFPGQSVSRVGSRSESVVPGFVVGGRF